MFLLPHFYGRQGEKAGCPTLRSNVASCCGIGTPLTTRIDSVLIFLRTVNMKIIGPIVISTALFFEYNAAHKQYCDKLPNCALFLKNNTGGLGHISSSGGGPRNQFGLDFQKADYKWTLELCKMDSDNDTVTNGCELGDCCCNGVGKEERMTDLSAPGNASSKPLLSYDLSKCKTTSSADTTSPTSTADNTKSAAGHSHMPTAYVGCISAILTMVYIHLF